MKLCSFPLFQLLLLPAAMSFFFASDSAQAQTELFPEGNCNVIDPDTSLPEGFIFPNKLDKPWMGGNRAEVVEESGDSAVRFENSQAFPYFDKIKATIPLPEGATSITVSGRFKAMTEPALNNPHGWSGFHVHAKFSSTEPRDGEPTTEVGDVQAIRVPGNTDDWVEESSDVPVPEGAKWVVIQIMTNGLVGSFWFDDISVTIP